MRRGLSKKNIDKLRGKVARKKEMLRLRKEEKERKKRDKAELTAAGLSVGPDGSIGTNAEIGRKFSHLGGEHEQREEEYGVKVAEHGPRGSEHSPRGAEHGVKGAEYGVKGAEYRQQDAEYCGAGAGEGCEAHANASKVGKEMLKEAAHTGGREAILNMNEEEVEEIKKAGRIGGAKRWNVMDEVR